MQEVFARVSGDDYISSGIIISEAGKNIELFPFQSDPNFSVTVEIDIVDSWEEGGIRLGDETGVWTWHISLPWLPGKAIGTKGTLIATDKDFRYYINSVVTFLGTREEPTLTFQFSVVRRAKA